MFDYKARRLFFKARRVFFKGGGLFSRLLAGGFKTRIIRRIYRAETATDTAFSSTPPRCIRMKMLPLSNRSLLSPPTVVPDDCFLFFFHYLRKQINILINDMRQANLFMMSAAMLLAACGGTKDAGKTEEGQVLIEKSDIKIEGRRMTPEALWAMGRIGGLAVSPDGKKVAYTVAYYSVAENKSNREIFVMNADGTDNRQITRTVYQENEVAWIKGGSKLAFLSNDSGSSQLYEMNPDGTGRRQLTDYDKDIEGFKFSPDGRKLLFVSQVKTKQTTADKYPDLPKSTGIIVTDLMYKHWDEWVTGAPHPFVADFDGDKISNVVDILEGEPYESPMRPWGGVEQLAWNPSSDEVAYTCRKKTGLEYAVSTNSDIYIYDLKTKQTRNITEENKGYDTNPSYSPDGKYIAWQSMERDGYEADLNRLFIMDLATGEKRFASQAFESNVDAFVWSSDAKTIYFTGVWHGETHIRAIDLTNDSVKSITSGMYDYEGVALCGDKLIAKRHSMSMADEIYTIEPDGSTTQLTQENKAIYDQLETGKVEPRWMKTTDGKQMLTWVIYPPKFDPNKKYPAVLFCEGGPQSPVSQFWSYRWNFQIMQPTIISLSPPTAGACRDSAENGTNRSAAITAASA
ncbi:prolyl oligopeptidase family protein [Bacteroides pyogenes JCM 6292]|uniref:Prolyl oligopeptidase family protein n=2 Tax=Bacteroides pyogenes TaxID=310300 RepID=W4PJ49_9BACE|nr:prolyl oligopeptidase family protein [Bacteroides pyogenes JCM 6292]GAE19413.1 prolyl oligopeptidase family protein [Bacteroides pyogenes DSM 20611 = JCM 6294]